MFWTLLKLNCLDKIVLDFHVHNQRNLVETQKGETLFFFFTKNKLLETFVLKFRPTNI